MRKVYISHCPFLLFIWVLMGKDKEWVRVNLRNAVNYARDYFEYVTIGAQDASRADMVSWKVI